MFNFWGRGTTRKFKPREFKLLDINGERLTGWLSERNQGADTSPEFPKAGEDGWEMVGVTVNQDMQANGVTWSLAICS